MQPAPDSKDHRAVYASLGCGCSGFLGAALLVIFNGTGLGERLRLPFQIRAAEPELIAYACDVRAGRIPKQQRSKSYELPRLPWYAPGLDDVTMDENDNVFFITYSWLTFDNGFVLQHGDRSLLGDGMEPRLYARHSFGPWSLFTASH